MPQPVSTTVQPSLVIGVLRISSIVLPVARSIAISKRVFNSAARVTAAPFEAFSLREFNNASFNFVSGDTAFPSSGYHFARLTRSSTCFVVTP